MRLNRWSITNMKVWRRSCRVDLFFFSLACGDSGYSPHWFFSEEVSCCKWKLSIGFIYPLFLFSAHLLLFLSPVSSVISSKHHYVFFPFCCPCLSSPLSLPLYPFVLFSPFLSLFPSHLHSVATPPTPSLTPLSCLLCICPLQSAPQDKQDSKFALQHRVHHHTLHCK